MSNDLGEKIPTVLQLTQDNLLTNKLIRASSRDDLGSSMNFCIPLSFNIQMLAEMPPCECHAEVVLQF